MSNFLFDKIAFLGIGLIGSSLARAARQYGLASSIHIMDHSADTLEEARALGLGDLYSTDPVEAVKNVDLVVICTPVGAYKALVEKITSHLKPGAILSDVGSVKYQIVKDIGPLLSPSTYFIPGHPVAGTEHSGPKAGFAELFKGRWAILTPLPATPEDKIALMKEWWQGMGSDVEIMDPAHHDQIMAIVSHLPHLIAYTIVGTAVDLEDSAKREVIKFSASGFRDFTRIAASDPIMWRDIFLNNKEAVLEMLGRFTEDLTALQRAIRWGEGDKLEDLFTRTRAIRRSIIDAKQA